MVFGETWCIVRRQEVGHWKILSSWYPNACANPPFCHVENQAGDYLFLRRVMLTVVDAQSASNKLSELCRSRIASTICQGV